MNYKIAGAIKKNRKNFIIFILLWLFIAIVLLAPFAHSTYIAKQSGTMDLSLFLETFGTSIVQPFSALGSVFSEGASGTYISTLIVVTIFYAIFFFIGFAKSAPKNEYTDIEHGSSDWSEHGEQYKVLDKNKGIILAENNYLPVNKPGNVNVLVVGRFRFR